MQLYQWTTHDKHPTCKALAGQQKTLDEWRITIMPGHYKKCRCTLDPVQTIGEPPRTPAADLIAMEILPIPIILLSQTGSYTARPQNLIPHPVIPTPDP